MTHDDRSLDRAARSWLEEGPTRAPDRAIDAALSRIQTTPQERDLRIPWRFPTMFTNRVVIAALAIVLIVAGGGLASSRFSGVGQSAPTPTSTSSPAPSVTATPLASLPALPTTGNETALQPGTYRANAFAAPFTITLPAGWVTSGYKPHDLVLRKGDSTFLAFVVMDSVYPDPCHTRKAPKPVRPGVQALVDALSSMAGFKVEGLADATVGGAPGKSFTLTNSIDPEAARCSRKDVLVIGRDGDGVPVIEGANGADSVWVVDVSGTTVLIGGPADALFGVTFDS